MTDHACPFSRLSPDERVETSVVSTDATVLSATTFRDKPLSGRPARLTRPYQVVVQGMIWTVSPAGEPASPFVPHPGAVRGFVFGFAAGSLNEVS
jgi:hypothetical protein